MGGEEKEIIADVEVTMRQSIMTLSTGILSVGAPSPVVDILKAKPSLSSGEPPP